MKARIVIAVLASSTALLLLAVVGLGAVVLVTRPWQVPPDVREACRTYASAYERAEQEAAAFNDVTPQTELAHPWRTADTWSAQDQADLERAALQMQRVERDLPEEWLSVAWQFTDAMSVMGSVTSSSAVEQQDALSDLHAACVAR